MEQSINILSYRMIVTRLYKRQIFTVGEDNVSNQGSTSLSVA